MELSVEILTVLLIGSLVIFMLLGVPVAFALGGIAVSMLLYLGGVGAISGALLQMWKGMNAFVMTCLPLFIFMGIMLERSGIADDLFDAMYKWLGGLKGGLAVGTILICAIFAAMTGVTGAACVTMSYIAIPAMQKRGYNKRLAIGTVAGGSLLGILIPPSMDFIIVGMFGKVSIGGLFAAGMMSGLALMGVFCAYILIRSYLQPGLAPALAPEERVGFKEKLITLRGLILPAILIVVVLGSIFSGIATPTEAAAVGGTGSVICVAVKRRLSWSLIKDATERTFRVSVMVLWVIFGGYAFSSAFSMSGATRQVTQWLTGMGGGRWMPVITIMGGLAILGSFTTVMPIIMVASPIFMPLMKSLGFSPIWFGVLLVMNIEMSFITPPYGYNLFYMRAVTPDIDPTITVGDIYIAVLPFVGCVIVGIIIVCLVPQLATWLPELIFGVAM